MVESLAVAVIAAVLVLGVYLGFERLGRRATVPASLRFVAWTLLGLLLIDQSCARAPGSVRPLVLLDASLSMAGVGSRWDEARQAALQLGDVRTIGPLGQDSAPLGGRSAVGDALLAATTVGRPIWLVTDGEIDDASELSPGLLAQAGVRVLARERRPDLAVTGVIGPDRVSLGDTLRLEVEVSGFDMPDRREVTIDVASQEQRWATRVVPLEAGSGRATLEFPLPGQVQAGAHLLTISLRDAADAESRTDQRLHPLTVLPTPGIVIIAPSAGWESRFFFRALSDVASLPVRGYYAVERDRWVRMGDVVPTTAGEVDQAVSRADLLVRFGELPERMGRVRARARWDWVAAGGAPVVEGDWYLSPGGVSPVSGAFVALPTDSFPPATGLANLVAGPRDWVGLSAALNRRGGERAAVVGRDSSGIRQVQVGVSGLWRWAFRGGESEQAYRSWVAATTAWLLGASDSTTGVARPVRAVVQQGRPVLFERLRPEAAT
ncbi:MAG: vWA domain-containing protein, partial [Gemmatimonadales bacterium]